MILSKKELLADFNGWNYDGWSNMAKVVYKRTYSRVVDDKLEDWPDTSYRTISGNLKLVDSKFIEEDEQKILFDLFMNRKMTTAGRGLWISGTDFVDKVGGTALNNPLHEDTRILTKEYGWIALKEIEGKDVTVLSSTKLYGRETSKDKQPSQAVWAPATISHAENHPCLKLYYKDEAGFEYSVVSSLNHRWFRTTTNHDWERISTEELTVGDYLPRIKPPKYYKPCLSAYQHGFFFGDGTRSNGELHQYGEDNEKVVNKIFLKDQISKDSSGGLAVRQLPKAWGKIPEGDYLEDGYVYSFLAGYFAADGYFHPRSLSMSICSARKEELERVKDLFWRIGVSTGEVTFDSDSSNYLENRELYRLYINPRDLNEHFFLKDSHLDLWKEKLTKKKRHETLQITKIEKVDGYQRVLCATVPNYEQFVTEGYCLTSNCWFLTASSWENYVIAQDLLMLGGGVGLSVEHRFVSKLPSVVDEDIIIEHKSTKDADFIVPDSREGWCRLTYKVLESFFVTGKSFTFSTVCLRGAGEGIKGFGGTASGPLPLIEFVKNLVGILRSRQGTHIRPIDAADILCAVANMVVAGNVRRSALMILGDAWDKEFLTIKRWDIEGSVIPPYRYRANFSVVADDYSDLHPLFWKSYNLGEPIGIFNRKNAQKYGRMGEKKKDKCLGVNPCAEATLENGEPCNLLEIYLSRIKDRAELIKACRYATRAAIRTTCAHYHHEVTAKVIAKNRRIGVGLTGILDAHLYTPEDLDAAYKAVEDEAKSYCAELGIPVCIRLTVVKPSGTLGKLGDVLEGCHPAYSRYMIQRIRFSSGDPLLPILKKSGHFMEMEKNQDGSPKPESTVVDFYLDNGPDAPCADSGFDTWKQLDALLLLQKHWADQAVSITVYYEKDKISEIKAWIKEHLKDIKSISFLLHQGHGFLQAPKEPITKEQYEALSANITPIDVANVANGEEVEQSDCVGGACPIK